MRSLETDADIHPDGSMKLLSPLPDWLRPGRQHLVLTWSEPAMGDAPPARTLPIATEEMLKKRRAAFADLRALGGLGTVIPDPAAWQRTLRQDRPVPGRD